LHSCTLAPLHPCTLAPLHPYTLTPLHPCTLAPLPPCTLAPLHPCTLAPLHPCTLAPSHPCTLAPWHPCTLAPQPPSPELQALRSTPWTLTELRILDFERVYTVPLDASPAPHSQSATEVSHWVSAPGAAAPRTRSRRAQRSHRARQATPQPMPETRNP